MAKANSPVRLQDDLMKAAALIGSQTHRSAAEQIEYWADIGRRVADKLSTDDLISLYAGIARLEIVREKAQPIAPDVVFAQLDQDRESGKLTQQLVISGPRYQSAASHPGKLERIDTDGTRTIGQFIGGEFISER
jgi:hypothetical protein